MVVGSIPLTAASLNFSVYFGRGGGGDKKRERELFGVREELYRTSCIIEREGGREEDREGKDSCMEEVEITKRMGIKGD